MVTELMKDIMEKTKQLIDAPTCCQELKEAGKAWLDSIGTEKEKEESKKFIRELEQDIMPIDQLIGFAGSAGGKQYFGEETAKNIVAHGKEIKAAGAIYCDCPACAAAEAILAKKDEILV